MKYTCKHLTSSDTGYLKALMGVFAEAFNEPGTYLSAQPSERYSGKLLAKKSFVAVVGLAGNEVIGGLTAYQLDKPEQERSEIYIYDLAVAHPHRRKGVATSLINTLKRIAIRRKVRVIFVQADPEDKAAIKLYESLGKKEKVYNFDMQVY